MPFRIQACFSGGWHRNRFVCKTLVWTEVWQKQLDVEMEALSKSIFNGRDSKQDHSTPIDVWDRVKHHGGKKILPSKVSSTIFENFIFMLTQFWKKMVMMMIWSRKKVKWKEKKSCLSYCLWWHKMKKKKSWIIFKRVL